MTSPVSINGTDGRRSAAMFFLLTSYSISILSLIKGFLFVPLYLKFFDLATYGAYLASSNIVGMLGIFDVGISTALYQRLALFHGRGESKSFAQLAGAGGTALLLAAFLISSVGWTISHHIPVWIHADPSIAEPITLTFRLTLIGSVATLLNQGMLGVPAAWQLATINATSKLGSQVIEIIVVVFALFSGWGIVSLGMGSLAGGSISLLITLTGVTRQWRIRGLLSPYPSRASLGWLFAIGVPTFISRIVGQVAGNLEVVLVSAVMGPSMAAVYGITERTFRLSQGFINPIIGSAFSALSHLMGAEGPTALQRPLRELRGLYTLAITLVIPGIVAINHDFIGLWVGADKFGGTFLTVALALSTILATQAFFLNFVAAAAAQIRSSAYLSAIEATLRILLMYMGLRILGVAGMALFASLGYAALALFVYPIIIGRGLKLDLRTARNLTNEGTGIMVAGVGLGGLAALILPPTTQWLTFGLKGILVLACLMGWVLLASSSAKKQLFIIAGTFINRFRSSL